LRRAALDVIQECDLQFLFAQELERAASPRNAHLRGRSGIIRQWTVSCAGPVFLEIG
jgi:hypothetical protein